MINIYKLITDNELYKLHANDLINGSNLKSMILFRCDRLDKARLNYLTSYAYDGHRFNEVITEAQVLVSGVIAERALELEYKRVASDLLDYMYARGIRKVGKTYLSVPVLASVLRMVLEGFGLPATRPNNLPPLPGSQLTEDGHGWDENGNQI